MVDVVAVGTAEVVNAAVEKNDVNVESADSVVGAVAAGDDVGEEDVVDVDVDGADAVDSVGGADSDVNLTEFVAAAVVVAAVVEYV